MIFHFIVPRQGLLHNPELTYTDTTCLVDQVCASEAPQLRDCNQQTLFVRLHVGAAGLNYGAHALSLSYLPSPTPSVEWSKLKTRTDIFSPKCTLKNPSLVLIGRCVTDFSLRHSLIEHYAGSATRQSGLSC